MEKKRLIRAIAIIFAITIAAELLVFNYKSIASNFYGQPVTLENLEISMGLAPKGGNTYEIKDPSDVSITISNLDIDASDILLNVNYIDRENVDCDYNVVISIQDEGWTSGYYNNNSHSMYYPVEASRYLTIHPSGNLKGLLISFGDLDEGTLIIESIVINARIPFNINIFRMLIVFGVLSFGYFFIKKESFMTTPINRKKRSHEIIIDVAVIVQIIIFISACTSNSIFSENRWLWAQEYPDLARQMTQGEVCLPDEPSQGLLDLENPYDYSLRGTNGVDYRWDAAYYNGKYYVYFGVVPCILYYLPYYLLTGNDLIIYQATALSLIIYCIAVFLLLYQVIKKVFPKTPLSVYLLLSFVMCNCAGGFFIARRPDCYSVPIITGMAFAMLGLALWLLARRDDKSLNKVYLALGSLCIALVAGCRPQITIIAFLAFPLFIDEIKDIKHHYKELIAAIVPFIVIAIALMYYNAIRFSSPFDFGATYNLTNYDMTQQPTNIGRLFDSLFLYFFQPPNITSTFPFINSTPTYYNYIGMYVVEYVYGGMFAVYPITIASLFAFKTKKFFVEKKWYYFTTILLVLGLIVAFVDFEMVGILVRYMSDFAGFFFLAAIMVVLALTNNYFDQKWYRSGLFIVCLMGLVYCFGLLCIYDSDNLTSGNPGLFYSIKALFNFLG